MTTLNDLARAAYRRWYDAQVLQRPYLTPPDAIGSDGPILRSWTTEAAAVVLALKDDIERRYGPAFRVGLEPLDALFAESEAVAGATGEKRR